MAGRIEGGPSSNPPQIDSTNVESTDATKTATGAETKQPTNLPADNTTTPLLNHKDAAGQLSELAFYGLSRAAEFLTGKDIPKLPTSDVLVRNDDQKTPKPEVEDLQKQLNQWRTANGKTAIKEDGYFGASTERAVEDFQRGTGLKLDSKAGVSTQNRLLTENDADFQKLDPGIKDQVRTAMKDYGQDADKVGNLRDFATTPGLSDLSASRQQQMLDLQKANPDDSDLVTRLKDLTKDGFLGGLSSDEFDSALNLAGSPQFHAMTDEDTALVMDGLKAAKGNTAYADNVKSLLEDPKFRALDSDEQTAVLSQVKNYPDARSVANIQRMLQKDWFASQDIEDKQRSLKVVAYLSQHDSGDRKVVDNTLNRFLDPASDYKLVWKDYDMTGSHITYGEGDDTNNTLYLNRGLLNPDNKKMVEVEETEHLALSTVPHEVNHIINKDHPANNYKYFEAEYRAWYVGFKAQFGRAPTNQEAMEQRITNQLDKDSFYGPYSAEALKKPEEAKKFYDFMSKMTGQKVTADNWSEVIKSDPSKWKNPNGPAPVPGGNIDNH